MSRWFRFYAEALRNPKVLRLSDKDFRLWVRLLAVASENDGHIAPAADLKLVLAMRLDHVEGGLQRLISGGLIDALADGYEPHGWAKFQYKSDVSTDRVHKHRAKRNVSETPPDTEADTDTERVGSNEPTPRVERARAMRIAPDWLPNPLPPNVASLVAEWPPGREQREIDGFRDYWLARKRDAARLDWEKTWHNRIRDIHDKVLRDSRYDRQRSPTSTGGIAAALDRRIEFGEPAGSLGRHDAGGGGDYRALPPPAVAGLR